MMEGVGLPVNKKGFRELQKLTHLKKAMEADRADSHRAFQRLIYVEEGLRFGGYM